MVDCAGILIFGFLLFEFGYLIGKRKPPKVVEKERLMPCSQKHERELLPGAERIYRCKECQQRLHEYEATDGLHRMAVWLNYHVCPPPPPPADQVWSPEQLGLCQ